MNDAPAADVDERAASNHVASAQNPQNIKRTGIVNDLELLKAAATAAGYKGIDFAAPHNETLGFPAQGHLRGWWSPLTDDGDALRLAVKLEIDIQHFEDRVSAVTPAGEEVCEPASHNRFSAARRAIVRTAAALGRKIGAARAKEMG